MGDQAAVVGECDRRACTWDDEGDGFAPQVEGAWEMGYQQFVQQKLEWLNITIGERRGGKEKGRGIHAGASVRLRDRSTMGFTTSAAVRNPPKTSIGAKERIFMVPERKALVLKNPFTTI